MPNYKLISLTQGKHAKVSPEDYEELSALNWHMLRGRYAARAETNPPGSKSLQRVVYMHRLVMDAPDDMEVDHINGDGLDNRRSNLRLATRSQNSRNIRKQKAQDAVSKYRGVWLASNRRLRKKWKTAVIINGKQTYAGYWPTEELAAQAYDAATLHYYGEFANPNFPDSKPATVDQLRARAKLL